jgi:hypothetical protein
VAIQQIDGGRQIRSGTITTTQLSGSAAITDGQLATSYIKTDGTRAFTGDVSHGTHKITSLADGTADADAATVGQLKALVNGLDQKASVRVATTAAGTLASSFANGSTVDGVTLATGNDILIKNQAAGAENGVYTVNASGAPTRRSDADASAEVTGGFTVWVNEGTTNGDTQWTLTTNDAITLGTTSLTFTQTDKSALTFGGGLTKSGNAVTRDDLTGDVTTTGNGTATTIANNAVTNAKMADAAVGIAELSATGTPNATTFLRGDNTWATPGGGGTLTPTNFVTRETPSGTVNGSNVTFTLANTPTAGTEHVYLNGLLQEPGAGNDYTISGAAITYLTAPLANDKIRVSYLK